MLYEVITVRLRSAEFDRPPHERLVQATNIAESVLAAAGIHRHRRRPNCPGLFLWKPVKRIAANYLEIAHLNTVHGD